MSAEVAGPLAPERRRADGWTWAGAVVATVVGLVGAGFAGVRLLRDLVELLAFEPDLPAAPEGFDQIGPTRPDFGFGAHLVLDAGVAVMIYVGLNLAWWYFLKRRRSETWAAAFVVGAASLAAFLVETVG